MANLQVTLCYVHQGGQLLLIRKKRGLGAGKINGPGGKVDTGETPLEAAIRETREEIGIIPIEPELRGELWFQFGPDVTHHCLIYLTERFEGTPYESEEAIPLWFSTADLPYDEMWDDDREWLPLLLAGKRFCGTVQIRGEQSRHHEIAIIDNDIVLSL